MAHRQGRPLPRADQHVAIAFKQHGQRESAMQPRKHRAHGVNRLGTALDLARQQMGHGFRVRLRLESHAFFFELRFQLAVILDDAIVNDRHMPRDVRMRIRLVRHAMRGPARVPDASRTLQVKPGQFLRKMHQLARRAHARELALLNCAYARRVIAAVLKPPQRIHQGPRHRLLAENADDTAHALLSLFRLGPGLCGPEAGRPAFTLHLSRTLQRQRVCRHILRHHAARADIGAIADAHGCDQ